MSVQDDARVQALVDRALANAGAGTLSQRLDAAWADLYQQRHRNSTDRFMAAAEHYMYARSEVARGGNTAYAQMLALIPGYEAVKVHPVTRGLLELRNYLSGDGRCSPATWLSVSWGMRGANQGLDDYRGAHP